MNKWLIAGAALVMTAGCGGGAGNTCSSDLDCDAGLVCSASSQCEPAPDLTAPIVVTTTVMPEAAAAGTSVDILFRVDEALGVVPQVLVRTGSLERPATLTVEDGRDYTFAYVPVGDEPEGPAGLHVVMEDLAGNQTDTPLGSVTFDFTAPVIGDVLTSGNGQVGAGVVGGLTVTVNELLAQPPVVEFTDGTPLTFVPTPSTIFSYSYTPSGSEPEGLVQVTVQAEDVVGNVTNAGPFNAFTFEFTPPDVSGSPVLSAGPVDTDDVLTLSISFDEVLFEDPLIQLQPMGGGATLNIFVDSVSMDGLNYQLSRTIQSTDPADTYTVRLVQFMDEAQNAGTPRDLGMITRL